MKEFAGFKINTKTLERVFEKIVKEIELDSNVDIKQMLIDIFKMNYKINQKQFAKFICCIALLVVPIEELLEDLIPFGKTIFKLVTTPVDEVLLVGTIASIISNETTSYNKYVEKKKYESEHLAEEEKIEVKPEELLKTIKEFSPLSRPEVEEKYELVSNRMQRVKEVSEYICYSNEVYTESILNYLKNNGADEDYIKINYKKLCSQCIFTGFFIEEEARKVVQNEMSAYIETHPNKLDTYRLKSEVVTPESYLEMKYEKKCQANIINNCCIITVESTGDVLVDTILLINTVDQIIANDQVSNIIVLIGSLLIEIDKVDNFNVQIISSEISELKLVDHLEKELKVVMSKYAKKFSLPAVRDTKQVLNEKNIELSVAAGIERLSFFPNITDLTVSHNELKHIIPFYNSQNKTEYIMEIVKHIKDSSYTSKHVCLKLEKKVNIDSYLSEGNRQVAFETIMVSDTISGNFDFSHICNVMNKLYALQITVLGAMFINLVVVINCGQGVFLEARIGKNTTTKLIDSNAILGHELETKLEKIIKDELNSQAKAISFLLNN